MPANNVVKVVDRNYLIRQFQNYDTNVVAPQIQELEDTKVDKVEGYGLSKNDFTDTLKTKLEGLQNYDDTQVLSAIQANTAAINTLNGDASTEGSIAKMTADAVSSIVAGAPSDFDTLKEMSDWISDHADSAASMNSQIQDHSSRLDQLESQIGDIDLLVETHDIDFNDLYGDGNPDVTLSASKSTLYVGETVTVTSNQNNTEFTSSDDEVATVNENGVVTAIAAGSVTISGSKEDFTTGTLAITVLPEKVEIVGDAEVYVGETIELTSNAENTVWTSSDNSIATVDQDGVVTGVAAGEVTITASADGYSNGTKGIAVSVKPAEPEEPVVTEINISGNSSVDVGDSITLTADVNDVTWSSSDDNVATVDQDGVVTGVAAGEVTITASADGYSNGTHTVTVNAVTNPEEPQEPENPQEPVNTEITIFGDESVNVGDSITLSADVDNVTWSSSDDTIATVDSNGVVTGVSDGSVTITASADGYNDATHSVIVNVVENPEEQ